MLGGLIRENDSSSESGLPLLYDLPLFGPLFGTTSDGARCTELIVLITPRVVQKSEAAMLISEEFRQKIQSLKPTHGATGVGQ